MKQSFNRIIALLMLLVPMLAFAAKAPTDEQLKSLCRDAGFAMQSAVTDEARQQAFDAEANKLTSAADITKITAEQVSMVFEYGGITLQPYLSKWLQPTLQDKALKNGGMFAFLAWKYIPRADAFHVADDEMAALLRFLNDGNLKKVIEQNPETARDIISAIGNFRDANWATAGVTESVSKFLSAQLPESAVTECVKVFNSAMSADNMPADTRQSIRKAVLAQYTSLAQTTDRERIKKSCQTQIDYLNGPFACGTLVGGKAPEMHFIRMFSTEGDSIVTKAQPTTLSAILSAADHPDVIMLDFWGTKCVPCLQSFPEMAEIQQHFQGKKVLIVGITSLMGYFVDTPNHKTVQCRNNPEKELALFPDYMKAMGVNWTIGITEEDVMNTDYGVLAIPHITLIDKAGNVRYNCLQADKDEKIKLIESLLSE